MARHFIVDFTVSTKDRRETWNGNLNFRIADDTFVSRRLIDKHIKESYTFDRETLIPVIHNIIELSEDDFNNYMTT